METTTSQPPTTTTVAHKTAGAARAVSRPAGKPRITSRSTGGWHPAAPAPSIAAVMACIKAHESGNYTEHSHISSGSGAYQYTPGTWQTWSARAGYPGYQYAYQAPPAVQDAVTVYTLTHGGAHNWSPAYGDDPCTVRMP